MRQDFFMTISLLLGIMALFVIALIYYTKQGKNNDSVFGATSNYVRIIMFVPETHADLVREALGSSGAGKGKNYSYASFSVKGLGRFLPEDTANPFIGKVGELETVVEERIETICALECLEEVIAEVKKVHPYEMTVIDIFPVYQIGLKGEL